MIYCPACGVSNRAGSYYCNQCGARLNAEAASESGSVPPPRQPGLQPPDQDVVGRLRALMGPKTPEAEPADPVPHQPQAGLPDWLVPSGEDSDLAEPPSVSPGSIQRGASQPPASIHESPLPEWLQADDHDLNPAEELDWAADIDFSNLPDWLQLDDPTPKPKPAPLAAQPLPLWLTPTDHTLLTGPRPDEPEGTGLLSGVRGPIPVEPISALPHPALRPPGETIASLAASDADAALFAQIAAGPLVAPPVSAEVKRRVQLPLLNLVLLLAVIVPLILRLEFFHPPASDAVPVYVSVIEGLAPGSLALLAFDYESGLADDLEPAVVATMRHLRSRDVRIVAVSTVPQGAGLAQRLWAAVSVEGSGYGEHFVNVGYLPGSEMGLRALLDRGLAEQRDLVAGIRLQDLPIGEGIAGLESVNLIVVASGESRDVQHWIEQVGSQQPSPTFLVVTTAHTEPVLEPYLAAGQLRGILSGVGGSAAYEQALGAPPVALRRLDAMTVGAALFILVVLLGNLVALRTWLRKRFGAWRVWTF